MSAPTSPIRFYFDFISPFAYLGWTQIHALAERHQRPLEVVPVLFAAMLDRWGHRGPAEIPPKRIYTWKYATRLAHDLSVPLQPPPAHPFNPLLALRIAALPMDPQTQRRVIDRLYTAVWASREGATDPGMVAQMLDAIGLPGAELVAQAGEPAAKERIKSLTAEAIEAGVFGVPSVLVDGELFWGQDSFPHVDRFLRGEDPASGEAFDARWATLPVGVHRKGATK